MSYIVWSLGEKTPEEGEILSFPSSLAYYEDLPKQFYGNVIILQCNYISENLIKGKNGN